MTAFTSGSLGIPFGRSQLIVVAAFAGVFFLFVPLCVEAARWQGLGRPRRGVLGVAPAPEQQRQRSPDGPPDNAEPPVPLFRPVFDVTIRFTDGRTDGPSRRCHADGRATGAFVRRARPSPPTGALNVIGIFVVIAGLQFFYRRFRTHTSVSDHRPVYVPTAIAIGAFALWTPRHPRVQRTVDTVFTSLLQGSTPGDGSHSGRSHWGRSAAVSRSCSSNCSSCPPSSV